jgi:3-methyladenine DNA glycosylase/8-oxoguanine DNA glycosylase
VTLVAARPAPHMSRTLACAEPLDVGLTFGPVAHALGWASSRIVGDEWWHTMNTPEGAVALCVGVDRGAAAVTIEASGPGGSWVIDRAPAITGVDDAPSEFVPANNVLASLQRRMPGQRMIALGAAGDFAAATVLGQRVTTVEARDSWGTIVRRHGLSAPGGYGLTTPPSAEMLARLPDWEWRRVGVEDRRSSTVRRLARDASRVDRSATAGIAPFAQRLRGIRGVGPWTAALITHFVAADTDAVPVGDWHLKHHVAYALAGERRGDDARMLELLEPFRPHRARAWRLLVAGTRPPARRVPRAQILGLLRREAARS